MKRSSNKRQTQRTTGRKSHQLAAENGSTQTLIHKEGEANTTKLKPIRMEQVIRGKSTKGGKKQGLHGETRNKRPKTRSNHRKTNSNPGLPIG